MDFAEGRAGRGRGQSSILGGSPLMRRQPARRLSASNIFVAIERQIALQLNAFWKTS